MAENLYIDTDNVVTWVGMKDAETGDWINDADSVVMYLMNKDPLTPNSADVDDVAEVQTLVPDAAATGGNFKLAYEGEWTANIAYNASFATIKAALETLTQVDTDDIQPGGNLLTADPANGGMTFTFSDKLGDTNLIEFDFTDTTGPTNAASSISETTKGVLSGNMIDDTGSLVAIPIDNHGLTQAFVARQIRIEGSDNINGYFTISKIRKNRISFIATYTAELLTGNEAVYIGVENGAASLSYVGGTNGNYRGILPDNLKNLILYNSRQTVTEGLIQTGLFYLFLTAKKGTSQTTKRIEMQAVYDSS